MRRVIDYLDDVLSTPSEALFFAAAGALLSVVIMAATLTLA